MSNKNLKPQIIALRDQGLTYNQIKDTLGCSKGTICFHLCPGQKEKTNKRTIRRRSKLHPYARKIEAFTNIITRDSRKPPLHKTKKIIQLKIERFHAMKTTYIKPTFTVQDVIDKFGENPTCYLTGQQIDINKPRTYQFDHIVPRAKGGSNSIDNLALCTADANHAKNDMSLDDFINMCKQIVKHHT